MHIRDSIGAFGLTGALLLLAACGSREPLRPAPGQNAPTTEELLTPTPIARPDRVGERLRRSEVREDDRFDLPPP
jgi:hypothetical protein